MVHAGGEWRYGGHDLFWAGGFLRQAEEPVGALANRILERADHAGMDDVRDLLLLRVEMAGESVDLDLGQGSISCAPELVYTPQGSLSIMNEEAAPWVGRLLGNPTTA